MSTPAAAALNGANAGANSGAAGAGAGGGGAAGPGAAAGGGTLDQLTSQIVAGMAPQQ